MIIRELPNERRFALELTESQMYVIACGLQSMPLNPELTNDGRLLDHLVSTQGELLVSFAKMGVRTEP